jgi:hypothetical protein
MSYHCRETQRILSDFSDAELPGVERSADVPDGREGDLTKRPQKRGEVDDHKHLPKIERWRLPTTSLFRTTAQWPLIAKIRPASNSSDSHIC